MACSIIIAALSHAAVLRNGLVLAAIWRNPSQCRSSSAGSLVITGFKARAVLFTLYQKWTIKRIAMRWSYFSPLTLALALHTVCKWRGIRKSKQIHWFFMFADFLWCHYHSLLLSFPNNLAGKSNKWNLQYLSQPPTLKITRNLSYFSHRVLPCKYNAWNVDLIQTKTP